MLFIITTLQRIINDLDYWHYEKDTFYNININIDVTCISSER